jgi:flagellin
MTELTTGDYQFEVLDTATSGTQGKVTLDTSSALATGVSNLSNTTAAATAELASGRYNLKITNVTSSTSVDYVVTNLDDNTTISVSGADMSAGGTAGDLQNAAKTGTLGVNLSFGTNPSGLIAGQSMNFEYIKSNQAKIELNDASGQAVQISKNAGGTVTGLWSYGTQGAAYDSGRGVQVTLGTFANLAKGEVAKLTYQQSNLYSVDVSTTIKAGAYMTTANYALDKVNSALSGLGSLMARLSFKEEAISTAQVNVEGAYNRIMNANMAEEQVNASKYSILQQTATAMLAQANAAPQSLLTLFR